ncbi:hypothetical protein MKZ38_009750 [Zalerion maritima]|uniref:Heterokaryon incompatibility domain-containing protein n=1 Tax=Zalerion maritima TaxID=339359 RepID=A0AAD5RT02_9PEZI|nr:hypothetical protein MKZ38_009750 [Zalerion maritima]
MGINDTSASTVTTVMGTTSTTTTARGEQSLTCLVCNLSLPPNAPSCEYFADLAHGVALPRSTSRQPQVRLDVVQASSVRGCTGCNLLWRALSDCTARNPSFLQPDQDRAGKTPAGQVWRAYVSWGKQTGGARGTVRFFVRSVDSGSDFPVIDDANYMSSAVRCAGGSTLKYSLYDRAFFGFFGGAGGGGQGEVPRWEGNPLVRMHPNPSFDKSLGAVVGSLKYWMSQCTENHEHCGKPSSKTRLPKRLLRIRGVGDPVPRVSLVETTPGTTGEYICLSWCWGGMEPACKTTPSTLEANKREIPWDKLPPIFKDAAMVTWKLGKEFLWIDAVCIVQGQGGDWDTEAGRMADVYHYACLTIMASKAGNPLGRLLLQGDERGVRGFEGKEKGIWCHEVVVGESSRGRIQSRGEVEPLGKRGWVLQEYLLSQRIAHFTSLGLVFECNLGRRADCRVYPDRPERHPFDVNAPSAGGPWTKSEAACWRKWWWVVTGFTELQLSFGGDKLPAISGLAKHFRSLVEGGGGELATGSAPGPGRYLAGMWEKGLLNNLSWRVDVHRSGGDWMLGSGPNVNDRPAQWRAPTWSWVSVDNKVTAPKYSGPPERVLKLVDFHVTPKGEDQEGQLLDARLTVRASCLRGELKYAPGAFAEADSSIRECMSVTGKGWETCNFYPDYCFENSKRHRVDSGSEVLVFPVAWMPDPDFIEDRTTCLALHMVLRCVSEERKVYERIGVAKPMPFEGNFWEGRGNTGGQVNPELEEMVVHIV